MSEKRQAFLELIKQASKQKEARKEMGEQAAHYFSLLKENQKQFSDLSTARKRAAFIRWKTIENLDAYLIEFEANFIKRGGKIIWAQDAAEAKEEILKLIPNPENCFCPKNNSIILKEAGIENLFSDYETKKEFSACIAEGDFITAEPGAVCLMNAPPAFAAAPVKIIVAGIDTLIPSLNDLELFIQLQSVYRFNTCINYSSQILFGDSENADENSSSDELYIVLIDNGRSGVMSDEISRQAIRCIGCGACNYSDAVSRAAGEKIYSSLLPGTIAAATLPFKEDFDEYHHLAEMQPFDNYSADVCPVNIDFTKIFLHTRKLSVEKQLNSVTEKWFYFFWKKAVLKRSIVKLKGSKTLGYFTNKIFNSTAKDLFVRPNAAPKSFNEQWRERMKM